MLTLYSSDSYTPVYLSSCCTHWSSRSGTLSKHLWSSWASFASSGSITHNSGPPWPCLWSTRKQCEERRHRATGKVKASQKQGGLSPVQDEKSLCMPQMEIQLLSRQKSLRPYTVSSKGHTQTCHDKWSLFCGGSFIPSFSGLTLVGDWAYRCGTTLEAKSTVAKQPLEK